MDRGRGVAAVFVAMEDEAMTKMIVSDPRRDADGNIRVTIPPGVLARMDPEKLYFLEPSGRVVDAKGNAVEPDPEPAAPCRPILMDSELLEIIGETSPEPDPEPEGSWRDRPPLL